MGISYRYSFNSCIVPLHGNYSEAFPAQPRIKKQGLNYLLNTAGLARSSEYNSNGR